MGRKGTEKSESCNKCHQKFYFLCVYVLAKIIMCNFYVGNVGDGSILLLVWD